MKYINIVCTVFIPATDDSPGLKKLEQMMLECAKLDSEISCFVESVEQMIAQVKIFYF